MPPEVYDGKPAKVAERLLKLKEKAAGHPILKAIGRGVIKFFKWIVATAFVLVLATIGTYLLENTWLRPISRIKNVIHNIENNLERKELDEFTKQRQREEFKAKQKADEQKPLDGNIKTTHYPPRSFGIVYDRLKKTEETPFATA